MLVSGGALVNGANEVNPDYQSEARFYAPHGDRGLLNLVPAKWVKAWRAFEDSCATIVEDPTPPRP